VFSRTSAVLRDRQFCDEWTAVEPMALGKRSGVSSTGRCSPAGYAREARDNRLAGKPLTPPRGGTHAVGGPWLPRRLDHNPGDKACASANIPPRSNRVSRSSALSLPCVQPGRTLLQQEAVSSGRDALRQGSVTYFAFIKLASIKDLAAFRPSGLLFRQCSDLQSEVDGLMSELCVFR
jgi:hypothetical protein